MELDAIQVYTTEVPIRETLKEKESRGGVMVWRMKVNDNNKNTSKKIAKKKGKGKKPRRTPLLDFLAYVCNLKLTPYQPATVF